MLCHGILLFLFLTKFQAVETSVVAKLFGATLAQVKKISQQLGCHVERAKGGSGVLSEKVVLKLPLFEVHEPKGKKKGRR